MAHGLNETQAETVITSHELLPKFKNILDNTPHVKKIIYFENPIKRTELCGYRPDVKMISFWEVVKLGKKTSNNNDSETNTDPVPPTPDSTCILMYTSGLKNISLLLDRKYFLRIHGNSQGSDDHT